MHPNKTNAVSTNFSLIIVSKINFFFHLSKKKQQKIHLEGIGSEHEKKKSPKKITLRSSCDLSSYFLCQKSNIKRKEKTECID